MRFRSCTQPSPGNSGKSCTDPANPNGFGPDSQTESCNAGSCEGITFLGVMGLPEQVLRNRPFPFVRVSVVRVSVIPCIRL